MNEWKEIINRELDFIDREDALIGWPPISVGVGAIIGGTDTALIGWPRP